MTDVVEIARKCRAELASEIERLDEFIRMAEKLMHYEALGAAASASAAPAAPADDEDEVTLTPDLATTRPSGSQPTNGAAG